MRLALRLGRSLKELLDTVSSEELTMWLAFDRVEPIGDWRNDLGFGVVASTLANINRKQDSKPFSPNDFMPFAKKPKDEPVEIAKKIRAFLVGK